MNPTIQLAAVTILAPAAAALAVLWLGQRALKGAARHGLAPLAFAASYWLGYAMLSWLQSRSDFAPARHWQWIPYLTLLSAAVGALTASIRSHIVARWALIAAVAMISTWLLVPTWPDLEPRRAITLPLVAAYLFLLTVLLEPLAGRLASSVLTSHLALTAACSAALIAALVSLTYGEPAVIAAAALVGCAAGAWLFPEPALARALVLVYAVNVGGWAFTGAINPRPPLFALLVTPLAPLALWVSAVGPLARKRGIAAIALQTAAVLTVLALAGGLAWMATSTDGDSDW
ncbi:MAG: hypothetical protein WD894_26270 [Pirellulales bacterium]